MSKSIKILIIVLGVVALASLITALYLMGVNVFKALISKTALLIYMGVAVLGLWLWGVKKRK